MHRSALVARSVALVLFVSAVAQSASANPPPEAFGTLPQFDGWKLAPDGKHIAVLQPNSGRSSIFVYEVGSKAKPLAIPIENNVPRALQWVSNDRIVAYLSNNYQTEMDRVARQWERVISISIDGEHAAQLGGTVSLMNFDDPGTAYSLMYGNVYRLGVEHTTDLKLIESGISSTVQWVIDPHGNRVARIDQPERKVQKYSVLTNDTGSWNSVATIDGSYKTGLSIEGQLAGENALAISHYSLGDRRTIDRLDLGTGAVTPLFGDPAYDVESAIADEWTGAIIGATFVTDRPHARYFDPKWASLQTGLEAALPNLSVHILSTDREGNKALVEADGPKQPSVFLYYDRTTKQASVVGNAYPQLTPADLGEQRAFDYKARDGLEIHGFLTLPPGVTDPKNLPLVVFPHGGPEARDAIGFDWWAQFMANRGYVVFQPNFRGSTGYGSAFLRAGDGEYGLKMLDDIADGTKALIASGTADAKRVCIVGASYGGYAALAAATFTPDLYACAASFAGISDVQQMFAFHLRSFGNDQDVEAIDHRRMGASLSDGGALAKISPAPHAAEVRAPILLLYSLKDVTVPAAQSVQECKALKAAGKDVQCVPLEGDDHYLSLSTTRVQMLKQLEAFLAKHLG